MSVSASFGPQSPHFERFSDSILDLFNESTWPKSNFDVMLCSGFAGVAAAQLCDAFRDLVRKKLRSIGVALYSKRLNKRTQGPVYEGA